MAKTERFCTTCKHWKHTGRFWGECNISFTADELTPQRTGAGETCLHWKLGSKCEKRGDKMKPAIKWMILAAVVGLSGACGGNMPMDPACAMEAAQECYESVQKCLEQDASTDTPTE